MISREELTEQILAFKPELQSRGINHVAMFGSRARGDAREDSDVDLMIDIDQPDFSLLDLIGAQQDLGDRLGLPVQMTMRRSLSDRMKERTRDDLIELF